MIYFLPGGKGTDAEGGGGMLDRQIFLMGLPGCGKRSLGHRAARELGLPYTEMEAWIAEGTGLSMAELKTSQGEEGFRKIETSALARLTLTRPGIIVLGAETPLRRENVGIMRGWGSLILIERPLESILATFEAERYPELGADPEARLRELDAEWMPVYRKAADVRMPDREDEETAYALLLRVLRERYHA